MEQTSGHTLIESLQEFLIKEENNLKITSVDFSIFFRSLRYDWVTNQESEKPKTLDEFLKTTIYNASAKRIGLQRQTKDPQSGQPGFEIEIKQEEVAGGFHIEVYHWENNGCSKPEPFTSKIGTLTGKQSQLGETPVTYLKRLSSERKGVFSEEDNGNTRVRKFEAPIQGIQDFKVSLETKSVKTGEIYNLMEVALDVNVPYETIGNWLTGKKD